MVGKVNRTLAVAAPNLLATLLTFATGWQPGPGVSAAPCLVSGVISTDTAWGPAGCDPYIVTASIVVPTGVTLTVEPGTTVKFESLKGLMVQGMLVARGTEQHPITFTSNKVSPGRGDWGSIHFTDSSTDAAFDGSGNYVSGSIIQYAVIEWAGSSGVDGAVNIRSSSPWIDHNTIRNNWASGVYAWGAGGIPRVL